MVLLLDLYSERGVFCGGILGLFEPISSDIFGPKARQCLAIGWTRGSS
jgi:hypothetical protein